MPYPEDLDLLETDPFSVRSQAYDLVLERLGARLRVVRIHRPDSSGGSSGRSASRPRRPSPASGSCSAPSATAAPPHGGFAVGIDRFVAILAGEENIREVIAFPKTQSGSDPMTGGPLALTPTRLAELGLRVVADRAVEPAAPPGTTGAS